MNAAARRLMAVHAHPADEFSKGAGTYASYAARGDEVLVVSYDRILRTAWPTEEFQLIDSKVETEMPETDLFSGVVAE